MGSSSRTVLVTGASGVVGRALAPRLSDHHVIGLVHSDATEVEGADELLRADLREERLGLDAATWDDLARRVDTVVHSAALTTWGQPPEIYQAINIDGTRRTIELARAAGAPVHYVSTCFVHAIERGLYDALHPGNVVKPYIWSKRQAELLLLESGLPCSISRPTNVVGDSQTGASSRPQIVQVMSDWVCRGKAPYFPAHPGNLVDVIAVDQVAIAIAGAIDADALADDEPWWLTVGAGAMTPQEALDIAIEHARTLGRELEPAPIVDPSLPLPVPLEQVPAISRTFLRVLIDVSEVTHACGGVLPTSLPALHDRFGVPLASDREAYRRSLEFWTAERQTSTR